VKPALRSFLARSALTAVGVLVATQIVPGLEVSSWPGLLAAALVLGLLNAFVRPILTLLSLPLVLISFGLFLWVINAALLYLVGWLVKPFTVASFWSALGGSAVISIVSWLTGMLLGVGREDRPSPPIQRREPPQRQDPPGGQGPVIDV
jgi:putative membrane protein